MMTQMDILTKTVMDAGIRNVNVFSIDGVSPKEAKFEVLYNE